jgi:hypothetical protein
VSRAGFSPVSRNITDIWLVNNNLVPQVNKNLVYIRDTLMILILLSIFRRFIHIFLVRIEFFDIFKPLITTLLLLRL